MNNEICSQKTYLHSLIFCFSGSAQDQLMFQVYIESPLLGFGHSDCISWLLSCIRIVTWDTAFIFQQPNKVVFCACELAADLLCSTYEIGE
jgi:hypothetical protein